jgi:hypothetical protein
LAFVATGVVRFGAVVAIVVLDLDVDDARRVVSNRVTASLAFVATEVVRFGAVGDAAVVVPGQVPTTVSACGME